MATEITTPVSEYSGCIENADYTDSNGILVYKDRHRLLLSDIEYFTPFLI